MDKILDKNAITYILNKKYRRGEIAITAKTISIEKALIIFSYFNYSDDLTLTNLNKFYTKTQTSQNKLKKIHDLFKKHKINISKYQRVKPVSARKRRRVKTGAEGIIQKLSPLLDVFNINKVDLGDALAQVRNDTPFSQEAILESYKELYLLLMKNARGEIVTKKTSVSYVLEDDEKGGYKKEIATNSNREKRVHEETQSHLPDGKSFAMAMVVMEVIDRIEQGDKAFATNDELNELYAGYLTNVDAERIAFKGKEYTDAELLEEEDGTDD